MGEGGGRGRGRDRGRSKGKKGRDRGKGKGAEEEAGIGVEAMTKGQAGIRVGEMIRGAGVGVRAKVRVGYR